MDGWMDGVCSIKVRLGTTVSQVHEGELRVLAQEEVPEELLQAAEVGKASVGWGVVTLQEE